MVGRDFFNRLVVVLQEKTIIYDSNSLAILDTIDTVPNTKGQTQLLESPFASMFIALVSNQSCYALLIILCNDSALFLRKHKLWSFELPFL